MFLPSFFPSRSVSWILLFSLIVFLTVPLSVVEAGGGGGKSFFSAVIVAVVIAAVTYGIGSALLAIEIPTAVLPEFAIEGLHVMAGDALFSGVTLLPETVTLGTALEAGSVGLIGETATAFGQGALAVADGVRSFGNIMDDYRENEREADAGEEDSNGGTQAEVTSAYVQPTLQRGFTLQGGQGGQQGGGGSCPAGYQVCGSVCLQMPEDGVCCASVGYEDRYCPSNAICRTDGQCESASGGSCSGSRGEICQSEENSCGMTNQARKVCDGSCPAGIPDDGECAPPGITLTTEPRFLDPNEICTIRWSSENATECRVTGPGVNATGLSGSADVVTTQTTEYTATCKNGRVVERSLSVNCQLTPDFNNI